MTKTTEIGTRLRELRRKEKVSQQLVAEKLQISQSAYSLIENSSNRLLVEHLVILSKFYQVTTDYILKGDEGLLINSVSNGYMSYYKIVAHAGFVQNFTKSLEEVEQEWYRIPGFNPTQDHFLFEVEGNSMVPTVLPRDIIICQKQQKIESIPDDSLVLLVTKNAIMIKRLRFATTEDEFFFYNDNLEELEVLKFSKTEIKEIMVVRGKITSVLVPHHQMASRGKMNSLEETLEFLKQELDEARRLIQRLRGQRSL